MSDARTETRSPFQVTDNFDVGAMDSFMRTPEVYWSAVDALAPQPEEIDFTGHILSRDVLTYACTFQDTIVGYVQFIKRTSIGGEIHTGFHRQFRGKIAKSFIQYAIALVFRDKLLVKIWAMIPSDNKPAIYLARHIGFAHEGRLKDAVVRSVKGGGPPVRDLVIMGLRRG